MPDPFVNKIIHALYGRQVEVTDIPNEASPENRFFVIPGKDGPRWIMPCNPSLGWPVLRKWQPYDFASRAKWRTLIAAYRMGQLRYVPGIRAIGIGGNNSPAHPSISKFAPVVYIGTPGPARKIVATLVDRRSRNPVSLFKAPLDDKAKSKIIHEAKILRQLSQEKPELAPKFVSVDQSLGTSFQEVISGKQAGRKLTSFTVDYLVKLKINSHTVSFARVVDDLVNEIPGSKNIANSDREVAGRILGNLTGPTALPAVWVHGDFTPWNIMCLPSGHVLAVDWEEAFPSGLPLFDLVHFYAQQAWLFNERELFPKQANAFILKYLVCLSIKKEYKQAIILACLTTDWLRSARDGKKERAAFFLALLKTQGEMLQ